MLTQQQKEQQNKEELVHIHKYVIPDYMALLTFQEKAYSQVCIIDITGV